ncbi:hypothetical protein JNUCC0626_09020 [Lentzea sp. JNUCC 0626]|uniref:hypothetical protein n=1 Tax=Lentzea sp. JNUCC 0626 TaxID=3367513 RepID=UPI003747DCCD
MALRRAWVLPLAPTAVVLLIALALLAAPPYGEQTWLLGLVIITTLLAAAIAAVASRISGDPTERPRVLALGTGLATAATPFAVNAVLGAPTPLPLVVLWLVFGLCAGFWQLHLCEGARSRPLHAAIGFAYTFVFTAVTLLLAVLSARLVD